MEITLENYLAENPGKTEADFLALKELSDADYHEEAKATYRQTWKNLPDANEDDSLQNAELSAEGSYFGEIETRKEDARHQKQVDVAYHILSKLTDVQRKRYIQHYVHGLSVREIAKREGTNHKSVLESLNGADKKTKKVLAQC